ncbi:MAG: LPS export ABC transporter ATP-binding protein [Thermoguttaceae bacterium]
MSTQIEQSPLRTHSHAPSVPVSPRAHETSHTHANSRANEHTPAHRHVVPTPPKTTPVAAKPILAVEGLIKVYGKRRVVDGVSFHVNAGEVVGLLGPNGAGKTTSFRMTCGLIKTNGGVVYLGGQDVTHFPMYRRSLDGGMGYLPQAESVFRNLSVQDNLLSVMELLGVSRPKRNARCEDLLEKFHLTHLRRNLGGGLSGGERRRLEIARALVSSPKIILLDEPFANIDPITVHGIQDIIRQLSRDGIAILITDHQVRETLQITQRGYIIRSGQVLCHGTPEEILANEEARKVYFGNDVGVNEIVGNKKTTHTTTHTKPHHSPSPPVPPSPPPAPKPQPRDVVVAQEVGGHEPHGPHRSPHSAAHDLYDAGDALRDILNHGGRPTHSAHPAATHTHHTATHAAPRPPRVPSHTSHEDFAEEHRQPNRSEHRPAAPLPPRVAHNLYAARNAVAATPVPQPAYDTLDEKPSFWGNVHRFLWGG